MLTRAKRFAFFMPTLSCLVSFCKAFPPLFDDVMSLLVQVGQVSAADVTTKARDIDPFITSECIFLFCEIWVIYDGDEVGTSIIFTILSKVKFNRVRPCMPHF